MAFQSCWADAGGRRRPDGFEREKREEKSDRKKGDRKKEKRGTSWDETQSPSRACRPVHSRQIARAQPAQFLPYKRTNARFPCQPTKASSLQDMLLCKCQNSPPNAIYLLQYAPSPSINKHPLASSIIIKLALRASKSALLPLVPAIFKPTSRPRQSRTLTVPNLEVHQRHHARSPMRTHERKLCLC